ncbi:MAG: ABC transporter permease [Bacilli bacterium]|nr:ABC transporter permease [Bacilli bacterium]
MKFNFLKMIIHQISRKKKRTYLTIGGLSLLMCLASLTVNNSKYDNDKIFNYLSYFPKDTACVSSNDESKIDTFCDTFNLTCIKYYSMGYYIKNDEDKNQYVRLFGVNHDYLDYPLLNTINSDSLYMSSLIAGQNFDRSTLIQEMKFIHINKSSYRYLFGDDYSCDKFIKIGTTTFAVVGVIDDTSFGYAYSRDTNIPLYMPITTMMTYFKDYDFNTHAIINYENYDDEALASYSKNENIHYFSYNTVLKQKQMKIEEDILEDKPFTYASTVVISVLLVIIMLFNIKQRGEEIGIKRALGASKYDIVLQFEFECILYSIVATLICISFTILFFFMLGYISLIKSGFFVFGIDFQKTFITLLYQNIIVAIVAMIPSFVAANLNIADNLKSED